MSLRTVEHRILPRHGERVCGDAVVVRREDDRALISVVDGLGHGTKAAVVADRATEILAQQSPRAGVLAIMNEVHRGLADTRGACVLVCIVSPDEIEVCSVGNVELRSHGIELPFVLTPGVVGTRMSRPRVARASIVAPARVVIYSDGLSSRFHLAEFASLTSADACQTIFERHRRSHDDATLVVADIG